MSTLETTVDGLKMKNPFVIGSGPPGTNIRVINRAFKEGWGGVIAKTISLDCSKVVNVGGGGGGARGRGGGGRRGGGGVGEEGGGGEVMGVDLKTLRPMPTVEGYTTPGGYSSRAVKPIALRMVMEIAQMIRKDFPGRTLSAIGGVETGHDAAEFILMGGDTVQVCTGVMKFGYGHVQKMCDELLEFMEEKGFESIEDFKGHALDYFTTHAELVRMQTERKAAEKAAKESMLVKDSQWDGDDFVKQSNELAGN